MSDFERIKRKRNPALKSNIVDDLIKRLQEYTDKLELEVDKQTKPVFGHAACRTCAARLIGVRVLSFLKSANCTPARVQSVRLRKNPVLWLHAHGRTLN